jgi:alpha-aminoadipic semialdehyde synthase
MDGKVINIDGDKLFDNVLNVQIFNGFAFEGLPNRDSLEYVDQYKLGNIENIQTMLRGTLRYKYTVN